MAEQKSCPYCNDNCNDFMTINQTADYSGIEMAISSIGEFRVRVLTSNDRCIAQDIIEFKCCPMCGRQFNRGEQQ